MIARSVHILTIILGLVLVVLAGGTGNPFALFAAFLFLTAGWLRFPAARITVGVLYGLSALQIFLFTGFCVGDQGMQLILFLMVSPALAALSVVYFIYKPLKLFLDTPKAR